MKIKLNIKNVLVLACIAIIMTSSSLFFMNISFATETAKITVETANLRETPSSDSEILELISKDETVEILEKSEEWSKVKYGQYVGYLRNDLLSINETIEENTTSVNEVANNQVEQPTENTVSQNEISISNETNSKDVKGKYKLKEDTKLKILPLIYTLDTQDISKDTEVEVTEIINNWACVTVNNKQGWVIYEKLELVELNAEEQPTENTEVQTQENTTTPETQTTKIMYVNSPTINVRSEASSGASLVTQLSINTQVEVISEENGWSKVNINGTQGYILSSLLSDRMQEVTRGSQKSRLANTQNTNADTSNTQTTDVTASAAGSSVVSYAKQFIGVSYAYGGSSPSTGFDCSGFTSYVYKHFGVSLPRTSGGQSGVGTAVSRANLIPGDLVIYSGHVAIYVGGGNVIHAPRPGKSVCIVPLDQAAHGFSGGRRIM